MTDKFENRRYVAALILGEIGETGYSNRVLDSVLNRSKLDGKGKAFVTRMVYGVVSKRFYLDYLVQKYCGNKKLTPQIKNVLRLGFYQLAFMNTVPDGVAVNETVALASLLGQKSATGMCNAVLRRFMREGKPGPEKSDLSVYYSVAPWIVKLWKKKYSSETAENLLQAFDRDFPVFIRVNTLKTTEDALIDQFAAEGITAIRTELPNCLKLQNAGHIAGLSSFKDGKFHVQDLSSQLSLYALDACPGDTVIDFCAAPGGKSFTAAQYMQNTGRLYSFDLYENKIAALKAGADRLGLSVIEADVHDATQPLEIVADKIICDVPCSGLGIMGKKPDLRYKLWDEVKNLPDTQLSILTNAAYHLKPGGTMIYSTCTLNPTENEGVVGKFLRENTNFVLESIKLCTDKFDTIDKKDITLFPHLHGCDGFYIAKIKRLTNET